MKTGEDYWEELSEESPAGETISLAITEKTWEACQKDMIDAFTGLIVQAKLCWEVYNNDELDDSFLKLEMQKLGKELKGLQ